MPTNVTVLIREESEKTEHPIITVKSTAKAVPLALMLSSKTVYGPPPKSSAPLIQTRPFNYCGVPTDSNTD